MNDWNRTYTRSLNEAGVFVGNPRGVRGGMAADRKLVSTTWTDLSMPGGLKPIWDGDIDFNGYVSLWHSGAFRRGELVRLIMLECTPSTINLGSRAIARSMVMPTYWRIVTVFAVRQPLMLHRAELEVTSISSDFNQRSPLPTLDIAARV